MTSFSTMCCINSSYCVPMCRMQGVVKMQSFNPIMGMKVECKAARGSRTQRYTHKNTMSAETGLSAWSLLSLCSGLSLPRRAMTGHQTCEYGLLLYRWKTVGSMVGSEKVTIILSALSHLSTQSAKTPKKNIQEGSGDCNQRVRKQWKSEAHSFRLHPVFRDWHIQHIQNDIYQKCPAVNQIARMPIKFTEFFGGRRRGREELELNVRVKQLEKLLRNRSGGNLVPIRTSECPNGSKHASALRRRIKRKEKELQKKATRSACF